MVDRINAPPNVYTLILGPLKNVNLRGERDFADVIKLKFLRYKDYSELSGMLNVNTRGHYKSFGSRSVRVKGDMTMQSEERGGVGGGSEICRCYTADFEDGGRSPN